MHSLGLSRVTWPLRRPTPWAGKRPDRGLTLDLAAQSVVLPSNSPSLTTKEVAGVRAQPNGARLSCGATFEHTQTYDSSKKRRRELQALVRPATIEPHDEHTLALHGHEPRTLPRAPTNIVFLGGARPNGARLSCGALIENSSLNLRAPP